MRTIGPGQSLIYRFTATRAGIWTYHCSSMPMSAHIAAGLFGAVVIEPPDLPPIDRSYVLIQSELCIGPQTGTPGTATLEAGRPDAVVFNGYPNQYDHQPLTARTGERARLWVLDAGPARPNAALTESSTSPPNPPGRDTGHRTPEDGRCVMTLAIFHATITLAHENPM